MLGDAKLHYKFNPWNPFAKLQSSKEYQNREVSSFFLFSTHEERFYIGGSSFLPVLTSQKHISFRFVICAALSQTVKVAPDAAGLSTPV